jgi:hypothetical protein
MNREKQDSAYDILMITTAFLRRPPLWQRRVFRGVRLAQMPGWLLYNVDH